MFPLRPNCSCEFLFDNDQVESRLELPTRSYAEESS